MVVHLEKLRKNKQELIDMTVQYEGFKQISNGNIKFSPEEAEKEHAKDPQQAKFDENAPGRCPRCNFDGELKWVMGDYGSLCLRCDNCNLTHKAGYANANDKFEILNFKCPIDQFPVIKYEGKYGASFVSPQQFN